MNLRYLMLFVLVGFCQSALSADLCEPRINPSNPRRIDIRFPGKMISVIGHRHPLRGDEGMELFLEENFTNRRLGTKDLTNFKQKLETYLREDQKAVEHWEQDLETLRSAAQRRKVDTVFVEFDPRSARMKESDAARMFATGSPVLARLGYSARDIKRIMTIALTPGLYLRHAEPNVFRDIQVASAEPSEGEINDFELKFCPPPQDLPEDPDSFVVPEMEQYLAELPRLIRAYNDCSGRDALIGKNLAARSGNSMMFIGVFHLNALGSLLQRECLAASRGSAN